MNIYATLTKERTDKGQCVNIDLFGENRIMLGRLVFRKDASAGAYVLAEDFFFRSGRLSIHASKEKADIPLKEIEPLSCDWCGNPATHKDWREIDETTTSTRECDQCAQLDTRFLLEREAKQKGEKCGHCDNPVGKRKANCFCDCHKGLIDCSE